MNIYINRNQPRKRVHPSVILQPVKFLRSKSFRRTFTKGILPDIIQGAFGSSVD